MTLAFLSNLTERYAILKPCYPLTEIDKSNGKSSDLLGDPLIELREIIAKKQFSVVGENKIDILTELTELYRNESICIEDGTGHKPSLMKVAQMINTKEIDLKTIIESRLFNSYDLNYLILNINYFDLRYLEQDEVECIIKIIKNYNLSKKITALKINDPCIRELPDLPQCLYIDCSSCRNLRQLGNLSQCRKFIGRECWALNQWPDLPECLEFNCSQLMRLTVLGPLPKAEVVTCESMDLEQVEDLPECRQLNLRNITSDELSLGKLPKCQEVNIESCWSLEQLPDLPEGLEINCHNNRNLKQVGALPKAQELNFSDCRELEQLPDLPECLKLSCERCVKLRQVGALPKGQELNFSDCNELDQLPDLPECLKLNCSNCKKLQQVGALPKGKDIVVNDCVSLPKLPDLPSCRFLYCYGCFVDLPQLPHFARVFHSFICKTMKIDISELKDAPLNILKLVAEQIQSAEGFPKVVYTEDGSDLPGYDQGGLQRDLFTQIIANGLSQQESGKSLPLDNGLPSGDADAKELEEHYRHLGMLLAYMYKVDSPVRIGNVFPLEFYDLIVSAHSEDKWLRKFLQQVTSNQEIHAEDFANRLLLLCSKQMSSELEQLISDADMERTNTFVFENAFNFLGEYGQIDKAFKQGFREPGQRQDLKSAICEKVDEVVKYRLIKALANGMQEVLGQVKWDLFCNEEPLTLLNRFQGELSGLSLKGHLEWEDDPAVGDEKQQTMQAFINHWIDKASDEDLEKFVFAVTASKALGPKKIKIFLNNQPENYLPAAHTCSFYLDLPANYSSQDVFNESCALQSA